MLPATISGAFRLKRLHDHKKPLVVYPNPGRWQDVFAVRNTRSNIRMVRPEIELRRERLDRRLAVVLAVETKAALQRISQMALPECTKFRAVERLLERHLI